jgi:hypothetical protein
MLWIDHISFRSCCHYLNDQSHQRNGIGTRETFRITTHKEMNNFKRIASLHPYDIYYSLQRDTPTIAAVWSRISLRRLWLSECRDADLIISTQTGLTWLEIGDFSARTQYCTNLLELTTPLPSINDYKYMPPSLTTLNLQLDYNVKWSFNDDNGIDMINHLPHLSSLGLKFDSGSHFVEAGAFSSLSRWSSLTKLSISPSYGINPPSLARLLKGLVHNGLLLHLAP